MKKTTLLACGMALSLAAVAQEPRSATVEELQKKVETIEGEIAKQKKLKVSGYIQAQYQNGQESASLKVGEKTNEDPEKSYNRIGIRRGRIKFTYEEGIVTGVFQLDVTENGVKFKDAYLNIKDPWVGSMAFRAGIFDRPFGYEIGYSSSRRESPERSTVFQTLFPDERDLGGTLVLQAPKSSPWSILKLEAGLFAGNGIKPETDNKKDFIGHLSAGKSYKNGIALGAGVSYYSGKVYQGDPKVYKMKGASFVADDNEKNVGKYAKREYIGFDGQFSAKSVIGTTQLRGEYLFGQQPGTSGNSKSPNSDKRPEVSTYIRKFSGGYVMLVQDLGKSPIAVVVKYDWYDPNTKVSKDDIGQNGTGKADVAFNTLGFGTLWNMNKALRLQAYYEVVKNEKPAKLSGYEKDRKDNVFTLRLQYKF